MISTPIKASPVLAERAPAMEKDGKDDDAVEDGCAESHAERGEGLVGCGRSAGWRRRGRARWGGDGIADHCSPSQYRTVFGGCLGGVVARG